jgi:hypothetical protein
MVFWLKKVMLKGDRYHRERIQSERFYQGEGYQKEMCWADGIYFRGKVD